jgi:tRNA pseudouridine65 synthase
MQILYRDESLVAVNKPAGLLVHRSAVDRHEKHFAMQQVRDQLGRRVFPVHRLDKATCGVLLFALDVERARLMTDAFTKGETRKTYIAVVRGFTPEHDVIDYPLKEQLDKMTDEKADQNKPAQEAVTGYERLATVELPIAVGRYPSSRYSLLRVSPRTGRKHQIRRHLRHVFHPVVGDTTHGDGCHNRLFRTQFACHRLLLAATGLSFAHPVSGDEITIEASLDDEFKRVVAELGWDVSCL